jgi:IPT/TIG domain
VVQVLVNNTISCTPTSVSDYTLVCTVGAGEGQDIPVSVNVNGRITTADLFSFVGV